MGLYILKLSACLLVFWALYVLLIEKQSTHQFKRFYLLGSLLVSAVIPLITFTTYIEPLPLLEAPQSFFIEPLQQADTMDLAPEPIITLNLMLWLVYGIGSMIFATRFSLNLSRLIHKIKTHEQVGFKPFIHVLLEQAVAPHSFFNYLFFSKTDYEAKHIPKEVHIHEEAHARQLHSLDILLIELLQIALWFNPLIYIIKHHIKLNHEFLADKAVLNHGVNTTNYQNILLDYLSHQQNLGLSSSINYSSIKKRIHVMTTKTSKQKIWMSGVLLLSITALLVYSLSSREQVENPKSTEDHAARYVPVQKQKAELYATEAQMSEYNNFMSAYKQTRLIIEDHYERAVVIYDKLMSDEQRDSVEKYPTRLIPQPNLSRTKPIKPTAAQFEDFKNGDKYAIWLDGEVIPNTELNNYSLSDIVHVTGSKIHNNASSQRFPQPFQYHLYTKNGFKTIYQDAQLRKYNETSKRYTDALRLFLNGPREDNSELLIQYEQTRNLYETFSAKDKAQYSIKPPPPPPAVKHTQKQPKVETGFIELKRQTLYFTKINGKLTYYNRQGFKTDKTGRALEPKVQTKANAVLPDSYISKVYKDDLVVSEFAPVDDKQDSPIYYQDGIGKKELAAYNAWAKSLNSKDVGYRIVKKKDYEYYFALYNKMSSAQKTTAEPFPALPPPPPRPKTIPPNSNAGTQPPVVVKDLEAFKKQYPNKYQQLRQQGVELIEGKEGSEANVPPPPPPPKPQTPKTNSNNEQQPPVMVKDIEAFKTKYPNKYKQLNQQGVELIEIEEVTETHVPPPPPPPDIKNLAAKGAEFYYNGKSINSNRAVRLQTDNIPLNIAVKQTNNTLKVYMEDSPIIEEQ